MRRLPISIFSVLRKLVERFALLVLLKKPANKDRKPKFPNKALTKTVLPKVQNKFMQKAGSLIGTDLCMSTRMWYAANMQ